MVYLIFLIFCMVIALGFGFAAAVSDVKSLIIPNRYLLFILCSFFPAFGLTYLSGADHFFSGFASHLTAGILIFAISYALYHLRIFGGGDAKMLTVFAVWVGLGGLMSYLFFMAVSGGLLAAATLVMNRKAFFQNVPAQSWMASAQKGGQQVPYGVAIFFGALGAFWFEGYIQPQSLQTLLQGS